MRIRVAVLTVALTTGLAAAQVVRLQLDAPAETDTSASLDTSGSVVYTVSTGNPFGTNPGHRKQIFRWNPGTGAGTQVTSYEEGVESVSVSGDGTWLAFVSNGDLLGTNHDESPELYVMQSNGTGLTQLTSFSLLPRPFRGVARAVISGSANRIVFTGSIDPFGTNPTYSSAVFVIDRNGSNLKQLAINVASDIVDISDDGAKVIFASAGSTPPSTNQLVGINATGTGAHTFTQTTGVTDASLAGNGTKVAYAVGDSFPKTLRARSFDGNPATIGIVGAGERPVITDDGAFVYHRRLATPEGIYKIASTGGTATLVAEGLELRQVSGSGTRIVAQNSGLVALDGAGGNVEQLTLPTFPPFSAHVDALSLDGRHAWYLATAGFEDLELFRYDFDTGTTTQLTDVSIPSFEDGRFRVSDDGNTIIFTSNANPLGQNPCNAPQVFKLAPLPPAGLVLTQVTTCGPYPQGLAFLPELRPDGQLIVFQGQGARLYRINSDGGGFAPITLDDGSLYKFSAISEGSPEAWVAYTSDPDWSLYRIKTDGSGGQRITMTNDECFGVSISGNGNRISFVSDGDFAGENSDHSNEVFVYDVTTQAFTQLTHDQEAYYDATHITRDGAWVFTGTLRMNVDTGVSELSTGFLHGTSSFGRMVPNATGTAWAFTGTDIVDGSPSGSSLFWVDATAAPQIQVGKTFPTVVTWDPSPDSLRYDVVRGSISGLSIAGSTVSLGPVACIEDDSPDHHTRGFEDAAIPAPGEAFFYVYRGSVGFDAATGSYGQGSGARERVAGAGGCNP
ncbi:MAG TPA: hypothetical protein VJ826_13960 [Candidatus Polarisedimenticolaceae bacterium]|nr:hypothetical protein [Candidatus Polarisedimenticolaceae bacterium]